MVNCHRPRIRVSTVDHAAGGRSVGAFGRERQRYRAVHQRAAGDEVAADDVIVAHLIHVEDIDHHSASRRVWILNAHAIAS